MANLNPRCAYCGRAMIFIGIGPASEPCCPDDCGRCACGAAFSARIELGRETVERTSYSFRGPVATRYIKITTKCRRCGTQSEREELLP